MKIYNKTIPVKIKKIIYFPPSKNYAVILDDPVENIQLPIIIGTFEAQAIALGIEKIDMPRPMTHDLLTNIMKKEGLETDKIIITKLVDGTFYANIYYQNKAGKNVKIDSRPSDAIALALRTDSNIYVAEDVMKEAGQKINITPEDDEKSTKSPANNIAILDKIHALQMKMQKAIDDENYELAAEYRDKIKTLESKIHN